MAKQQKIAAAEAMDIEAHPLWKDEEEGSDFKRQGSAIPQGL